MIRIPRKFANLKDRNARTIFGVLVLICLLSGMLRAGDGDTSPAGLVITNRADATYSDSAGNNYSTVSASVRVTVMAVPALAVSPDETAPSSVVAPNDRITRVFRLCNSGNVADFYVPLSAAVTQPSVINAIYFDSDASGTITDGDTPVTLGQTLTPRLAAGQCLGVLFDVSTGALAQGARLNLNFDAQATLAPPGANDPPIDGGTIINSVGQGVIFNSPVNPKLPPDLLVENLPRATVAAGQTLNYKLLFRNNGAVTARRVRVADDLSADLDYIPGSLRLNGRTLTDAADGDEGSVSGRHLELLIPTILPDAITQIEFQARLAGTGPNGRGVGNIATIGAENSIISDSSEAVAVVDPAGVVFAGTSGGSVRVPGARVTILTDERGPALVLDPARGYSPNAGNANPFDSTGGGEFVFALGDDQIGTPSTLARYVISAEAPGFRPRRIEMLVRPSGGLYRITLRALDGQAIANAAGFGLTSEPVAIDHLAALAFNIPMFELSTLEISKFADKQFADIGDIVTYRVQVRNAAASPLTGVLIRDTLPDGFVYASGTARIEDSRGAIVIVPEMLGKTLMFNLGTLSAGSGASISYRVRVGANAAEGEQFNTAIAQGVQPNGENISTLAARAGVRVRGGIFGLTQVVIGRVFEDRNANGRFDDGERAVGGVRIYLNNGKSVVTDTNGQYNFPIVDSGSMVVALDPTTMPAGYVLLDDDGRKSSNSWTRLLRTPLGGGSMLRQNFAIAPKTTDAAVDAKLPFIDVAAKTEPPVAKPTPVEKVAETRTTGTYTVEAGGAVAPVAPGEVVVVSPQPGEVMMSPALAINARVAKDWTLEAVVNGERVPVSNVGETRVDNRNGVTLYSFVGIGLKPGENIVRVTAIGADGKRGTPTEVKVFGRGPVERLELNEENTTTPIPGQIIRVRVRGLDQWGNPAADGQVQIQTNIGHLRAAGAADQENADAKLLTVQLSGGGASFELVGTGAAGTARLKATTGNSEAVSDVRFAPEMRPTLMVGLAELSVGRNAPEIANTDDDRNYRARLAVFYRGRFFGNNLLTLSYDSNRALNRFGGRDRFGASDSLDRAYPIFGDSSQRFEDAPSNSKLYARLDRGLSYAMFGDMEADMDRSTLAGYNRRLTGVKLHLERSNGDFVSLTGARPDTAFARDVFPAGGMSLMRLAHTDLLPGSEVVTLEVRDRRQPEIIISRETLARSVDYNIDAQTGEIFFLRPIPVFDAEFNLRQITVVYEYRADGSANYVYTGRLNKNIEKLGLRFGASYVNQRQDSLGAFQLGGLDLEKSLWNGGKLTVEAAASRGRFAAGVNVFDFFGGNEQYVSSDSTREHNGIAYAVRLDQPLPFRSRLRADFSKAAEGFFNPFGGTVAAGSRRFGATIEIRPSARRGFTFGVLSERNRTRLVDNSRLTFSALWTEQWRENLRTSLGFDHRVYDDATGNRSTDSNLVTAGVEYRPTEKVEIAVKREQNLTEADPTYPDQTTFSVRYQLNKDAKLFLTQRLASAPITPIGDFSGAGFAGTRARSETAIGIETKLAGIGAVNGRYQIENGINGTDSFAVLGLQNRWNLNKQLGIEAGFERGFLLRGDGESFNSGTLGLSWSPVEDFRATARYELRDRNGLGQLFTLGAAGKIGDNWSTLARGQWAQSKFAGRRAFSSNVTAATAFRPQRSDAYALLFSYNRRELFQQGQTANGRTEADMRDRYDTISSDGLVAPFGDLEIYGRFAMRFAGNGNNSTSYASALTLLGQLRAQQRLGRYFDLAGEGRWLNQPSSSTFRRSFGAEFGVWAMPDLRFGLGYNFSQRGYTNDFLSNQRRRGVYFTLTTKLSNLFNLFGTPDKGLVGNEPDTPVTPRIAGNQDEKDDEKEDKDDEQND